MNKCIGDDTKVAARRRPRKQTIRFVERGYLSHCRHSVKKICFPKQNFTEIGHRLMSYGLKRYSIWQPCAIMNF